MALRNVHGNCSGLKSLDRLARHQGVDYIYRDSDGIWVELKKGWCNSFDEFIDAVHGIHENNVKDILLRATHIVPCDCDSCRGTV